MLIFLSYLPLNALNNITCHQILLPFVKPIAREFMS